MEFSKMLSRFGVGHHVHDVGYPVLRWRAPEMVC